MHASIAPSHGGVLVYVVHSLYSMVQYLHAYAALGAN